MKTELKIHWDGPANGLSQHRLSIGEFGRPLNLLLRAYRNIAANIVSEATGKRWLRGRAAARLDLEMTGMEVGSLGLTFLCVARILDGEQMRFAWIESDAMRRLVESIGREKDGRLDNAHVRKYLRSLNGRVARQKYGLYEEGRLVLDVGFEECSLPEDSAVPKLAHVSGRVVGVGFEPGNCEVSVMDDSGATVAGAADENLVNAALELRAVRVHALFVFGKKARILWIRKDGEEACPLAKEEIREEIFARWGEVMRRLSL